MDLKWPTPQPDEPTKNRTVAFFVLLGQNSSIVRDAALIGLIEAGICIEARQGTDPGQTPLCLVAKEGDIEAVKALLKQNADVRIRNNWRSTPLHNAALRKHVEIAKILLAHGAEIDAKSAAGITPLLNTAFTDDNKETIELLLAQGAEVDARDSGGDTPLHLSTLLDFTKKNALFAKGANIYAQNDQGKMPLDKIPDKIHVQHEVQFAQEFYTTFVEERKSLSSVEEVYQILSVWPLSDPKAPIDRAAHMRQIFSHTRWESLQQAAYVITQLQEEGENPSLCASLLAQMQQSFLSSHTSRLAFPLLGRAK